MFESGNAPQNGACHNFLHDGLSKDREKQVQGIICLRDEVALCVVQCRLVVACKTVSSYSGRRTAADVPILTPALNVTLDVRLRNA